MDNVKIIKKLSEEEYEKFKEHKDVEDLEGSHQIYFNVDEYMGYTKCRITVREDLSVEYDETFVYGTETPLSKCTDKRMLKIMSHRLNILLNE